MTDSGGAAVTASTSALVRTVDALTEDRFREPSLLPGWARSHVVAHLALNAEGLAAALDGVLRGTVVPMYPSQARRDADIAELATAPAAQLRDRLLGSCTRFDEAWTALDPAHHDVAVPRVHGGPEFVVRDVPMMRRREVEIHHADLDVDYDHGAWPADFVVEVLDDVVPGWAATAAFSVHADDLDRTWHSGDGGPVISGRACDLAWWVTGRGRAGGLRVTGGALPELGRWR